MRDDTNIADGIAVTLLLAGIVLASAAVGGLGSAPGTSQATDVFAEERVIAMFPINNVTAGAVSLQLSLDGKGNDPFPAVAFPINNVIVSGGPWDGKGTDRIGDTEIVSADVKTRTLASTAAPDELPQDMDRYKVRSGPRGHPQLFVVRYQIALTGTHRR